MDHSEQASDASLRWTYDETTAIQTSKRDRLAELFTEFVYKPGVVAWSDWRTRIGFLIVGLYVLMGTVGVVLYRAPATNQAPRYVGPFNDMAYPLGTDMLGQDLLALIIHATPKMLVMILSGGVFATVVATAIGTLAGLEGGRIDSSLMLVSDIAMTIPGLPLVMVLAAVIRPESGIVLGILLTINYWAGLGRAIRSQVLSIREHSYVEASQVMGVSTPKIIVRDVIPNLMPYITVNFVNAARFVIFSSVGLYYLGFLPYTNANWGVMLQQAYSNGALLTLDGAHWILVPVVTILVLSVGLILLAQGLDRVFNPRVRTRLAEDDETTATAVNQQ